MRTELLMLLGRAHFVAPHLDAGADLVADFARTSQALFISAVERCGIRKTPVQLLRHPGKDRTAFRAAFVADGDDIGESSRCRTGLAEVEHGLSLLLRNINADLAHRFDGQWIELPRFEPGAMRFKMIAAKFVEKGFRHLTAGAVVDADEENFFFHVIAGFAWR
jgi:hypothetical protein